MLMRCLQPSSCACFYLWSADVTSPAGICVGLRTYRSFLLLLASLLTLQLWCTGISLAALGADAARHRVTWAAAVRRQPECIGAAALANPPRS